MSFRDDLMKVLGLKDKVPDIPAKPSLPGKVGMSRTILPSGTGSDKACADALTFNDMAQPMSSSAHIIDGLYEEITGRPVRLFLDEWATPCSETIKSERSFFVIDGIKKYHTRKKATGFWNDTGLCIGAWRDNCYSGSSIYYVPKNHATFSASRLSQSETNPLRIGKEILWTELNRNELYTDYIAANEDESIAITDMEVITTKSRKEGSPKKLYCTLPVYKGMSDIEKNFVARSLSSLLNSFPDDDCDTVSFLATVLHCKAGRLDIANDGEGALKPCYEPVLNHEENRYTYFNACRFTPYHNVIDDCYDVTNNTTIITPMWRERITSGAQACPNNSTNGGLGCVFNLRYKQDGFNARNPDLLPLNGANFSFNIQSDTVNNWFLEMDEEPIIDYKHVSVNIDARCSDEQLKTEGMDCPISVRDPEKGKRRYFDFTEENNSDGKCDIYYKKQFYSFGDYNTIMYLKNDVNDGKTHSMSAMIAVCDHPVDSGSAGLPYNKYYVNSDYQSDNYNIPNLGIVPHLETRQCGQRIVKNLDTYKPMEKKKKCLSFIYMFDSPYALYSAAKFYPEAEIKGENFITTGKYFLTTDVCGTGIKKYSQCGATIPENNKPVGGRYTYQSLGKFDKTYPEKGKTKIKPVGADGTFITFEFNTWLDNRVSDLKFDRSLAQFVPMMEGEIFDELGGMTSIRLHGEEYDIATDSHGNKYYNWYNTYELSFDGNYFILEATDSSHGTPQTTTYKINRQNFLLNG